jgi:hypothetical protein
MTISWPAPRCTNIESTITTWLPNPTGPITLSAAGLGPASTERFSNGKRLKLLGVEPYVTLNAGLGDEWSAAEYVEYANGSVTTPMGKVRAANGHPKPYHVRFWGIGNEAWGD